MKSPLEYFIIEQDTNPRKGEREAQERLIKKLNRIKKKGNIPDKLPYDDPSVIDKPESVKNQMAKNIAKQDIEKNSGRESGRIGSEGSGKVKDTVKPEQAKGYKPTEKVKLDNSTSGSAVRSNKAQQKPLGRVVGRVTQDRKARGLEIGDIDPKDSKQLEAQRKARIDTKRNLPSGKPNPNYGKATQKGVENFAQNRGGYGRGRKLSGDEWKKISGSAKKISSDPSSKAYKDIESKINQNRDYGGKRAKVMNPKEVSQVNKEISKSKTVNTKGGKLTIQRTSKLLDTKTRKGRIANVSSTPPTPTRQPGTRYSVKGPGSSTGSLSKGDLKFSGDVQYNKIKNLIKNTDGRSTNRPTPTPKKFTTFRQGNLFGGNQSSSSTTQGFRPNNTPDPNIIKKPKNYNPDQGVLDFNKKKTTLKPTPVSTGKKPLTNPQSMLRQMRKSTPKFDSSYNKKGDAKLQKLLKKSTPSPEQVKSEINKDRITKTNNTKIEDPWKNTQSNTNTNTTKGSSSRFGNKEFKDNWRKMQTKYTSTKTPSYNTSTGRIPNPNFKTSSIPSGSRSAFNQTPQPSWRSKSKDDVGKVYDNWKKKFDSERKVIKDKTSSTSSTSSNKKPGFKDFNKKIKNLKIGQKIKGLKGIKGASAWGALSGVVQYTDMKSKGVSTPRAVTQSAIQSTAQVLGSTAGFGAQVIPIPGTGVAGAYYLGSKAYDKSGQLTNKLLGNWGLPKNHPNYKVKTNTKTNTNNTKTNTKTKTKEKNTNTKVVVPPSVNTNNTNKKRVAPNLGLNSSGKF